MSVWVALFVAPEVCAPMEKELFLNLVSDLLVEELVTLPCAVLGGAISVESPLGMTNVALYFPKEIKEGIQVYYKGEDTVALFKALEAFPYGQSDLCVWFQGFNWENPEIREDFEAAGNHNANVLLYALARPQMVRCYNPYAPEEDEAGNEYEVQTCFRTSANYGPHDIGDMLLEFLEDHLGPDLIIDCSYS